MTTDPKDAEIARLTTELRVYMDAAEAHAVETMRQRDRAEKAEAERDAALAQVATAITGNKSGTICRDCRGVGMIHCSDPFNCGGMQPYTVEELKSALSRHDAQMRAEGMRMAAGIARSIIDGRVYFNERARSDDEAFTRAILAAAEKDT